jgi:hypothetical protein
VRLGDARALAREWVFREAVRLPGFAGAFFHGSSTWLSDEDELPATSDLDLLIVLEAPAPPDRPGKFLYRDLLLEVSYLRQDEVGSAEAVLGNSHLAGSFRAPNVIAEPCGRLTALQAAVAGEYAQRRWVRARCRHAVAKIRANLQALREAEQFHDQVAAWLFAAGVTTHVLLAAGLRNPTVRLRYAAARELLAHYGRLAFHEELLDLLGCAAMSRERAAAHLAGLAGLFDAAAAVTTTPFPFAADISGHGRTVAIDGSRELIERNLHREAIFWILATYSRCRKVLHHDAPRALQERYDPGYRALLRDLGIASPGDLLRRGEEIEAFLPRLWEVAEAIMETNPEIEDSP